MTQRQWLTAGVMLAAWATGCTRTGSGPGNQVAEGPTGTPSMHVVRKPTTVNEPGVILGRVEWEGPLDTLAADATERTIRVNGLAQPARPTPRLRVHAGSNGVADAVLWVEKPPSGTRPPEPRTVTLQQRQGDFVPHVQAVPLNSSLQLTTTDDRADVQATGAANFSQTWARGQTVPPRPLARAGLVELRSEVHPWMTAYVQVFDHPYFAASDTEGRFRLPPLPPGEYVVKMWHEDWRGSGSPRLQSQTVTVTAEHGVEVRFVLSAGDGK